MKQWIKNLTTATLLSSAIAPAYLSPAWAAQAIVAIPAQPPALDPQVVTVVIATELGRAIYETLVTQDSQEAVKPGLATSWVVSDDGTEIIFTLRKGVKFHNGADLTAEDVVASLQRWSRLSIPGKQSFSKAEWSVGEEGTVVLKMPHASYKTLPALASGYSQPAVIMPKSIAEAAGDKPAQEIIGTGPYRLKDWVADQYLTLERYADYTSFEGSPDGWAGDRTPKVDVLKFVFVADDSTRILGLTTGEYDLTTHVPYDSVEELRGDNRITLTSYPYVKLMLFPNKANGFFTSQAARQALSRGIDREEMLYAAATDPEFFQLTNQIAYEHQSSTWSSDIGKDTLTLADASGAKEAFEEAGYEGEELVLLTSSDYTELYNSSVVLQQQLQGMGVNLRIEAYDWPSFVKARSDNSKWDLMMMNNTFKPDPTQWAHLSKTYPGSVDEPLLEGILSKFERSRTIEEASAHYDDLIAYHHDYVNGLFIGNLDRVVAYSQKITAMPMMGGPILWGIETKSE